MKGTIDDTGSDGGTRRGLFGLGRRNAEPTATQTKQRPGTSDAVAMVDDLARRMDELIGDEQGDDGDPVLAEFDLQRALLARAEEMAAAGGSYRAPQPDDLSDLTDVEDDASHTHMPTEAPVQQQTSSDTDSNETVEQDDLEARLEAAMKPIPTPAEVSASVTLEPTYEQPGEQVQPASQDAVLSPTVPTQGVSAAASIGIDVDRMVQMIEDEARSVQHRMELELRTAHARAEEILDRAEAEAEKIREHGQSQARVLLGEVEEIISEAQQTGEQILLRANEEASSVRSESAGVMQQAQAEARSIVETARREGEQVLAEQRRLATVRAQEAMREQDRLKDQIRRLEERRRQVLESLEPLISQLTQMMPAGVQAGAAAPQNVVQLQQRAQQPSGTN